MAASAIVIDGAELNQQAAITTDDLPRVYRGKSRSHRVVGVPERALLTTGSRVKPGEEILLCASICGTPPVEVKEKVQKRMMFREETRCRAAKGRMFTVRAHDQSGIRVGFTNLIPAH
jgi:hypothetical protein